MAGAGLALALAGGLLNGLWSQVGWQSWVQAHRAEADTMEALGYALATVMFPAALGIVLVIVLPVLTKINPDLPQRTLWALVMVGVPTLLVAWFWQSDSSMFWFFTVPPVVATLLATSAWVLPVRSGWARPRQGG